MIPVCQHRRGTKPQLSGHRLKRVAQSKARMECVAKAQRLKALPSRQGVPGEEKGIVRMPKESEGC